MEWPNFAYQLGMGDKSDRMSVLKLCFAMLMSLNVPTLTLARKL